MKHSSRRIFSGVRGACAIPTALLIAFTVCPPIRSQDALQPAQVNRLRVIRNAVPLIAAPANQNPIQQMVRTQLQQMLKVELSFASRAAKLNENERRALVGASVKWLDEFVVEFAKNLDPKEQQMWLQGMRGIVMVGEERSGKDPRALVQSAVAKVVSATLPKEKAAAYENECAKRAEFYRDVAIANLVERIDEKVILSADQRTKITASLAEHWDASWAPHLEVFTIRSDVLPKVPEMWIRAELNASQTKVFNRRTAASQRVSYGRIGIGMDGEVIDDIDLDDRPPAAENTPDN